MLVLLYDLENWFFQLPFNEGHFFMPSCSCFCSMLVLLYDLENWFFQLPNVDIFWDLWLMFASCFHSMLVTCNLYDSSFQLPFPRSGDLKYWCKLSDIMYTYLADLNDDLRGCSSGPVCLYVTWYLPVSSVLL